MSSNAPVLGTTEKIIYEEKDCTPEIKVRCKTILQTNVTNGSQSVYVPGS